MADMTVVILLVLLALVFDFINGFHDAANSIATVVSAGEDPPQPEGSAGRKWSIRPSWTTTSG